MRNLNVWNHLRMVNMQFAQNTSNSWWVAFQQSSPQSWGPLRILELHAVRRLLVDELSSIKASLNFSNVRQWACLACNRRSRRFHQPRIPRQSSQNSFPIICKSYTIRVQFVCYHLFITSASSLDSGTVDFLTFSIRWKLVSCTKTSGAGYSRSRSSKSRGSHSEVPSSTCLANWMIHKWDAY